MEKIRDFFGPRCEVIASARTTRMRHEERIVEELVLPLLERRPCTAADIGAVLGISPVDVVRLMSGLVAEGKAAERRHGGAVYYSSASGK